MRKRIALLVAATMLVLTMALGGAGAALAYTLNDDGTGFVGKGEVQTAFGWNNQQLQRNADGVSFQVVTETEYTWTCTNTNNQNTQERERVTTEQQLVDSTTRDKNQVTGFTLLGTTGEPTVIDSSGNQLYSCPTNWVISNQNAEVISSDLYAVYGGVRVLL
jgi:hypothetical protein